MFGEHASFIIPAYLVSAAVLGIATLAIRYTYKKRLSELKSLEDGGVKRRSSKKVKP